MAYDPGYTLVSASGMTPAQVAHQNPKPPKKPKSRRPPPKPKYHPPKKPQNPLAPLTDAQLQAQSSASVQAAMGPIIQSIKDAIAERSKSGQAAITGYTGALGNLFSQAAPQTAAAYQEAQGAQTTANNALADRLNAFGSNLASEQGSQLATINAPNVVNAQTAQTAQTAQGAANAGFANGSAELGALIAHSAAGQAYGAKLPGIAGLTGLQTSRHLQAQLNSELSTQLSQAQANAAQQVASTYQHLKDLEVNKALAVASGASRADQLAYEKAVANAKLTYQYATLHWKKIKAKADAAAKKAAAAQTAAAKKAAAKKAKEKGINLGNNASGNIGSGPGAAVGGHSPSKPKKKKPKPAGAP